MEGARPSQRHQAMHTSQAMPSTAIPQRRGFESCPRRAEIRACRAFAY
eukprot:CAMPEP_0174711788 /NCGR_PEP_ID=MMETSP1094-20130205/13003_1 /TAXON_ID=156173 /ORGANISM="Chrysochromulina brevifilum, Strain UTEX LB 985" /LENGTH=47 /DNA_ID= /DNA_START= /DNA_END= /DNA_ORIENTATION=